MTRKKRREKGEGGLKEGDSREGVEEEREGEV